MKKVFIVVTLLLGITLVAMLLTKPEPQAHYDAVVGLAQSVVDQEMNSDNVKKKIAQVGADKLAELGIEGVDAETLEKLGADVDLSKVTELGKDVAMNTAGFYLQSHLTVNDYYVVTVGLLNHRGKTLPVTLGIMGKVVLLVNEEQVKQMVK
jgi:regulatory protein YycI of two-component signal transduction system YycFG